jgi:ATP-dependent exoDNAse (exonuclease V) beta subunit
LHNLALTWDFPRLKKGADEDFKNIREDFKKLLKEKLEPYKLPEVVMQENGKRDHEIIAQVIHIVREFEVAYSQAKLASNKLDFNDLEKYMCLVLGNSEVVATLRAKYKYIFIDEYQDTNPMQEKILAAVSGEKNIFMVGDVKQSIYGFRGCEATIFAGKMTDMTANLSGKVVCLNENFRSRENILKFANLVFGKVMKQSTCDIDYDATSRLAGVREGGIVDVTLINNAKGTAAGLQAAVVAQKVAELIASGVEPKDIAILARNRGHFGLLADTLEGAGISVNVAAEQNAAELFEIALLNNFLFAVSNFYNDVPLVLLMQSFVFGFTPEQMAKMKLDGGEAVFFKNIRDEKFLGFLDKYNRLSKTHSVVDIFSIFLTEYKIIERLLLVPEGRRMVGNIHAYLDKLRGASYAATVSEFLYLLENELVEISITPPPTSDAVQITTIHSSKGLEYPNVIIFDVGAPFNLSDTRQLMVVDKTCGLCVYTLDSEEFTKTMSIARLGATISARRFMIAEEMRLLYVAMTRAKERLFLVGGGNINKMSSGYEDYDILCSRSFLHFLAPALFEAVRDDCFGLTVVDAEDVTVESREVGVRVLVGVEGELSKSLREVYEKPYPYKQGQLKNSVSSLTRIEEETRVKGQGDFGTQLGTQFHKEMQNLDIAELEKLIPEIIGYTVYRELAFLQSVGDKIIQGAIDLLAVKDGHAIIVDYKTTRASAEKLVELYKPQLEMYAGAVKQAIAPKRISVYIYSSFNNRLIEV